MHGTLGGWMPGRRCPIDQANANLPGVTASQFSVFWLTVGSGHCPGWLSDILGHLNDCLCLGTVYFVFVVVYC